VPTPSHRGGTRQPCAAGPRTTQSSPGITVTSAAPDRELCADSDVGRDREAWPPHNSKSSGTCKYWRPNKWSQQVTIEMLAEVWVLFAASQPADVESAS
jgi:hypothetical protein